MLVTSGVSQGSFLYYWGFVFVFFYKCSIWYACQILFVCLFVFWRWSVQSLLKIVSFLCDVYAVFPSLDLKNPFYPTIRKYFNIIFIFCNIHDVAMFVVVDVPIQISFNKKIWNTLTLTYRPVRVMIISCQQRAGSTQQDLTVPVCKSSWSHTWFEFSKTTWWLFFWHCQRLKLEWKIWMEKMVQLSTK